MFDNRAAKEFDNAHTKAFWRKIASWISGKNNQLLPFDEVRERLPIRGQHSIGRQTVPIKKIVGSTGRYNDFDRAFLPLKTYNKARWVNIRNARYQQVDLPPVDLIKIGDAYFVRDGNHRVSVARERGQEFIDAFVIEIEVPVPFTTETRLSDLRIIQAQVNFLDQTRLTDTRSEAHLEVHLPEDYQKLLEHINFHRWLVSEQKEREISIQTAALSWYDNIYLPLVEAIRDRDLQKQFPNVTETELYLWIVKYQWFLRIAYRDDKGTDFTALQEAKNEAARQMTEGSPTTLAKNLANILKNSGWVDTLVLQQERREFFEHTCLADLPQGELIEMTVPGQYEKLLDHIAVHRWFLGEQRGKQVSYDEASVSWFEQFYLPLVKIIREQNVLAQFPGRTETDLYLWIVQFLEELRTQVGGEVPIEKAVEQFAEEQFKNKNDQR